MEEGSPSVSYAYHHLFCEARGRRCEYYIEHDKDSGQIIRKNPLNKHVELELWQAILDVIRSYTSSNNLDHGNPIANFPIEVADLLGNVLESILVTGSIPATLQALKRSAGASKYSPIVVDAMITAVLYVKGAHSNIIADKHPVKTVRAEYGYKASRENTDKPDMPLSRDTWREWWRTYKDAPGTEPLLYWNDPDLSKQRRAEMLISDMRKAALVYRRSGRPDYPDKGG